MIDGGWGKNKKNNDNVRVCSHREKGEWMVVWWREITKKLKRKRMIRVRMRGERVKKIQKEWDESD